MPFWREQWGIGEGDFGEYVRAFQEHTATANGVFGSKMMWGYFDDFLAQAKSVDAVFPDVKYLWIRRRDKVRQDISWWRADRTGEWALAAGGSATPERPDPPSFDVAAVKNLITAATKHEESWRAWF